MQLGACSYRVFALYNDYLRHKELYATYSEPWYADIVLTVTLTAITVLITAIAYFVVDRIIKMRSQEQPENELVK